MHDDDVGTEWRSLHDENWPRTLWLGAYSAVAVARAPATSSKAGTAVYQTGVVLVHVDRKSDCHFAKTKERD